MTAFDPEHALADLLKADVLFANEQGGSVTLYVLCNDIFGWGVADAEDLPLDEVKNLWEAWKADPKWGYVKWCIKRRKQLPQQPVIEHMKKDGSWSQEIEQNL